jgi:hypothetical protein
MAKDPAFLFYPGDWQGGTTTFTRHMKGCYMDLLVAQFNSGPLSLEEIKTVLGSDFGGTWPTLRKKFKQNGEELFFNERLDVEMKKRKAYSQKQTERINKRWNKSGNTVVLPVENENRNEIEDETGKGGTGETPMFHATHSGRFTDIDLLLQKVIHDQDGFVRIYAQQGVDKVKLERWLENFNKWLRFTGCAQKIERDYRTHFGNWLPTQDLTTDPATYEPAKLNNGKNKIDKRHNGQQPVGAGNW